MNCDCINVVDDKLREKNLKLTGFAITVPAFTVVPTVATAWVDASKAPRGQKRNPPAVFGSYCPFCGKPVKKGAKR